MAVYTEDFAGAAGDLTSPWVQARLASTATLQRNGSGLGQGQITAFDILASYNNTIGNDQYSQIVPQFTGPGDGSAYIYLAVRAQTSAAWYDNVTGFYLLWSDGGSDTSVLWTTTGVHGDITVIDTANSFTFTSGDVIKLEVIGTTLKVYKNGTAITWTTSGTDHVTDSHVASGVPGVGLFGATDGSTLIDNWEGGDTGGGSSGDLSALIGEPICGSSVIN